MRRIIISLVAAGAGLLLGIGLVSADGGPHGGYTTTTDKCAACHRIHTGQGEKLLRADRAGICLSCHDGTGAPLDVWDGVRLAAFTIQPGNASRPINLTQTPISGALRGGGFVFARVDSGNATAPGAAISNTTTGLPVTSAHVKFGASAGVDGNGLTPNNIIWGNGAIGSGNGKSITSSPLACMDCHNPHGNGNYRILRPIPRQSGAATGVIVPDEATKNYTTTNYWLQYETAPTGTGQFSTLANATTVSNWCSQCHTRYLADAPDATRDSGDPIFRYRHRSNAVGSYSNQVGAPYGTSEFRPFCLQCHVSHGSNAQMTGWAADVPWPGGTVGRGNESTLLKIDNRGTCVACHGTQPGGQ